MDRARARAGPLAGGEAAFLVNAAHRGRPAARSGRGAEAFRDPGLARASPRERDDGAQLRAATCPARSSLLRAATTGHARPHPLAAASPLRVVVARPGRGAGPPSARSAQPARVGGIILLLSPLSFVFARAWPGPSALAWARRRSARQPRRALPRRRRGGALTRASSHGPRAQEKAQLDHLVTELRRSRHDPPCAGFPPTVSDGAPVRGPALGHLFASATRSGAGGPGGMGASTAPRSRAGRGVALKVLETEPGTPPRAAVRRESARAHLSIRTSSALLLRRADGVRFFIWSTWPRHPPRASGRGLRLALTPALDASRSAAASARCIARDRHGDLKPANIVVTAGVAKLTDFGVARARRQRERRSWTPPY